MIAFIRKQPVMVALAAFAAVLLIVIAIEAQLGARLRAGAAPGGGKVPAAEPKLLPPLAAVSPEQAYSQTTARPLFTPTRRPAPPVDVAQAPAFVKGQFVLVGVTIAGDTRIAMLREKANGRIHRVEKGREVNGIKVGEIQPEAVTMTQAGDSEVLALTVQKPVPGAQGSAVQLGPFTGGAPSAGFPIPPQGLPAGPPQNVTSMPPGMAAPATPAAAAGQFGLNQPGPVQLQQQPVQTAVPMSPEELLARRRARRTPQTQ